jgi:hypothetical protein
MLHVIREFDSNVPEGTEAARIDANEIARAQLLRFRRRLGFLTLDQELQIEQLLTSTVMKVSLVTQRVMEALPRNPPAQGVVFPPALSALADASELDSRG